MSDYTAEGDASRARDPALRILDRRCYLRPRPNEMRGTWHAVRTGLWLETIPKEELSSEQEAEMQQQTVANRVVILEQKMESLQNLPDRVTALELQISQFRGEVRVEFSALREEIRAGDEETRRYMRVLHEDVISRIALLGEHLNGPDHDQRRARRARRKDKPGGT